MMKEYTMHENGFEQYMRNVTSLAIPREVEGSFRNQLIAFREKMESADLDRSASPIASFRMALAVKKTRYILASGFIAALLLLGVFLKLWDRTPKSAYGEVVDMLKNAKSVTYKMLVEQEGLPAGMQKMTGDFYFKSPGSARMVFSMDTMSSIGILDYGKKRGITLLPQKRQYITMDFKNLPAEAIEFNVIQYLQSLPNRADSLLGEKELNGKMVQGYLVEEKGIRQKIWLDASVGNIIQIDMDYINMKGIRHTLTDFMFNVVLDDSLFNLAPPEGYSLFKDGVMSMPEGNPMEQDLITFLQFYASVHKEELFCPSVNDMGQMMAYLKEMDRTKLMKRGKPDQSIMNSIQNGMKFFMFMKPENDWHYAGKGVKLGTADIPIAWWKPDSSETYHVIYGDLKIRGVQPEELKKPEFNRQ